jgi:ABC-type histidine transport system ATPase subunit
MEDLAHEGATMIVVTHEMHFAREAADRVVYLDEGEVIEQGAPDEILNSPQDPRTQRFLRRFLAAGGGFGAD